MKIKLLKTYAHLKEGETHDVPEKLASELMTAGFAEKSKKADKADKKTQQPEGTENSQENNTTEIPKV